MHGVKQLYSKRLEAGEITPDPAQAEAVELLDALAGKLLSASNTAGSRGLFGFGRRPSHPAPRGLYIWGSVGRGKSMLMDLFHDVVEGVPKKRIHFHDFMLGTHKFIHDWRKLSGGDRKKHPAYDRAGGDDPIPAAAKNIANSARLLCFDEFHVTSITDAMILGRLFEHLMGYGVTIVATSNRHPNDLYKDGISRELFLPFIARLLEDVDVLELRSARDYRLERLTAAPVYYAPLGTEADAAMDAAFDRLIGGATPEPETLDVDGRILTISGAAAGVGRTDFNAMCAKPLGAADYLTLARHYHTLLLDHVPLLSPENRNEAARFVTLVDALYESKTKLVMSAAAEPDDLYPAGDGSFEFERTASRLHEMRSADYLAAEREAVNSDES